RPFNAYGPGERTGEFIGYAHVIPDIVKKVRSGQSPLEILGDGMQSRSYTYVDDVASGILFAAEHGRNDDFNIGTGVETTVRELAERIWALCGRKEALAFRHLPVFATDVRKRVPDVKKIFSLGWRPQVDLQTGLKETVSWLEQHEPAQSSSENRF
ncbi:MAG TPA: NAD-dependent epimerase/dehydratase family protein, partial [archaeon]|nr:NAD-dependent epimerase/dehydratase family protein [archaeon]